MVEKNSNNEKLLLYIFSGDLCNINLWYIYTFSILKCLKLAHEVVQVSSETGLPMQIANTHPKLKFMF